MMESPIFDSAQANGTPLKDERSRPQTESVLRELAGSSLSDDGIALLLGNLLKESSLIVGLAELDGEAFRHEVANDAARRFFHLTEETEDGMCVMLDSLEARQFALSHRIGMLTGEPVSFTYAHVGAGEEKWLDVSLSVIASEDEGTPKFLYVGCPTKAPADDVQHSRKGEALFEGLVETTYTGLVLHDRRIIACNKNMAELFGYEEEEMVGTNALDQIAEPRRRAFMEHLRSGPAKPFETVGCRKDGSTFFIETVSRPYRYQGRDALVTGIRDITPRIRMEEYLIHNVTHDDLTGIPNRNMFVNRLWSALTQETGRSSSQMAVAYMDVDRFKYVNDNLGHLVGDQLLIMISNRLQSTVRDHDLVARLGGDEFAALLFDITNAEEALAAAERIREHVCKPYTVDGTEVKVGMSVGIVMCDEAHCQPDDMLRDADHAMYEAKSRGSGESVVYKASMRPDDETHANLEEELRRALELDQFVVQYQPIVDIQDGRPAGVEALVRWRHPEQGMLQPSQFIPMAEDAGLVTHIDRDVLRQAGGQFRQWLEAYDDRPEFLSVNVSPTQLRRADFAKDVSRILQEVRCPPEKLILEITERTFVARSDFEAELAQLANMNVRVCVDDFATGYSSLNLLSRLPFDMLKLDKAFTQRVASSDRDVEVATTFVDLAHDLGMTVVAEGIETEHQLHQMQRLGCDFAQGFLFSPPVDAPEIDALLTDHARKQHH